MSEIDVKLVGDKLLKAAKELPRGVFLIVNDAGVENISVPGDLYVAVGGAATIKTIECGESCRIDADAPDPQYPHNLALPSLSKKIAKE